VGEGPHRNWDDYTKYGFVSAGQGARWRDVICGFNKGDVIVAYLRGKGYVGVGRIKEPAKRIRDVIIGSRRLLDLELKCNNMDDNMDDPELSEYVAPVDWICRFSRKEAKRKPNAGLYTTTHVRASLDNQPRTIQYIQQQFDVNLPELVK